MTEKAPYRFRLWRVQTGFLRLFLLTFVFFLSLSRLNRVKHGNPLSLLDTHSFQSSFYPDSGSFQSLLRPLFFFDGRFLFRLLFVSFTLNG